MNFAPQAGISILISSKLPTGLDLTSSLLIGGNDRLDLGFNFLDAELLLPAFFPSTLFIAFSDCLMKYGAL